MASSCCRISCSWVRLDRLTLEADWEAGTAVAAGAAGGGGGATGCGDGVAATGCGEGASSDWKHAEIIEGQNNKELHYIHLTAGVTGYL